jgi:hypothetical protein
MRHNPERLAWTILLTAFVAFCVSAVGFPLVVRGYLRNARRPLYVQVNAQRGIVRIDRAGSSRIDATSLDDLVPLEMFKGDILVTGEQVEGLLVLQRGDNENRKTLTSVVVYDNSDLLLRDAYSPRFGLSSGPHTAVLDLEQGRTRIEVQPPDDGRPIQIEVRTDHARILLNQGSYALDASSSQTSVTVRTGRAEIQTGDRELVLEDEQRAVASSPGELEGPLPAERDLIVNGDFEQGIDVAWTTFPNPASGSATVTGETDLEGETVAWFQHEEPQPAEVALLQTLNRNVKDLQSLILHLKVRVNSHSLSVCGSLGSECPVMVRVDYIDAAGSGRQWVHGFYAMEDPGLNLPYYCTTCPEPSSGNHDRVPQGAWYLYDSPNLMEISPPERRPVTVQSVRVYASGHSYDSLVTDVELLAEE